VARPFGLAPTAARRSYDITPSGKFVGLMREGYGSPSQILVVLHWFDELRERAPATR
jgi:hypothetical protein